MSRAQAANACVQSDSIKGLAQSIAKPAYTRLLTAEPALRRAVPTLIIAFLVTICLGAFVQVIDQTRQKRSTMKRDVAALADILAERLDRLTSARQERAPPIDRLQNTLPGLIPAWGSTSGRHVIVFGADQSILARVPADAGIEPDRILDVISTAQLLAAPSGQQGAVAYVIKTAHPEDLRAAIRQAFAHSVYLPGSRPAATSLRPDRRRRPPIRIRARGCFVPARPATD